MRSLSKALCGSVAAVFVLTAGWHLADPSVALAQDAQKTAMAQSLYEEAMKDFSAGKYGDACPKLERVVELVPQGLGARIDLGGCYEASGRLASAFGAFLTAESMGKAAGDKRAADAGARASALRDRLASLKVEVPADVKAAPGFSIKRDGVALTEAEFGLALSIDKGEHVILVTATGRAPWEKKITVADGEKPVVTVELGAAEGGTGPADPKGDPNGDPKGPGDGQVGPNPEPKKPDTTESTFMTPLRITGLVGGIVGVATVGIGVGLGMAAKSDYDASNEAEGGCNPDTNQCSKQAGVDLRDSAVTLGTAATGLVVAGAVLGAAGIVLFAVAPSDDAPSDGAAATSTGLVDPRLVIGPGFVSLRAEF